MPCETCGSLLIRINEKVLCPVCDKIQLLDRDKTIPILKKKLDEIADALISLIKGLEKNKLLLKLVWEREKFSRDFFEIYKGLDMTKFLTLNLLILKLMQESFEENRIPRDEEVNEIIEVFSEYIYLKNQYLLFKNGFAEALKRPDGKIQIIENERYFPIKKSYEDNLIMTKSKVGKKIEYFRKVYNLLYKGEPRGYLSFKPEEYVRDFYPVINSFYCSLLRNEIYYEVFGLLDKYSKTAITPEKLMDFVNQYPLYEGIETVTSVNEFILRAKKHFNMKEDDVKRFLIFSEKITSNFPMFIALDDTVHISHRTAFLIYIFLHAILYKDLFDKETEKRSKKFENYEIKKKFESIGWCYFPSLKDKKNPSMQIDGIATFRRKMLVVECKGWTIRPFYEYENIQDYLIRDIKGIVDGKKYTRGNTEENSEFE